MFSGAADLLAWLPNHIYETIIFAVALLAVLAAGWGIRQSHRAMATADKAADIAYKQMEDSEARRPRLEVEFLDLDGPFAVPSVASGDELVKCWQEKEDKRLREPVLRSPEGPPQRPHAYFSFRLTNPGGTAVENVHGWLYFGDTPLAPVKIENPFRMYQKPVREKARAWFEEDVDLSASMPPYRLTKDAQCHVDKIQPGVAYDLQLPVAAESEGTGEIRYNFVSDQGATARGVTRIEVRFDGSK